MRPRLAPADIGNSGRIKAKLTTQVCEIAAFKALGKKMAHGFFVEFRCTDAASTSGVVSLNRILGILQGRSLAQMMRIYAKWIVAGMEDELAIWNAMVEVQHQRKAMSAYWLATPGIADMSVKPAVAVLDASGPNPAFIVPRDLHVSPKLFDVFLRNNHGRSLSDSAPSVSKSARQKQEGDSL